MGGYLPFSHPSKQMISFTYKPPTCLLCHKFSNNKPCLPLVQILMWYETIGFSPYGFSPSTQAFKASTSNFLFHQQLNTSIIVLALYRPISKGRIPTQPTWD